MNTFVPSSNLLLNPILLDWRRLGKQRSETLIILNILSGKSKDKRGWANFPATVMWKGYENALIVYHNACIDEWVRRGYKNTMLKWDTDGPIVMPWWWDGPIHSSHRSNLLRKDKVFYGKYKWKEPVDMPYFWPTHHMVEV